MINPRPTLLRSTLLAAAAALVAGVAAAQTSAPAPAKQRKVELLFVQNAATIATDAAGRTLTLKGIGPTTMFFTDRPVRIAGHYRNEEYLRFWRPGWPDGFAADPPNAVLSVFQKGKTDLSDVVVTLTNPRLKGADLTYDVKVVAGKLPRAGGPATLFIDRFGGGFYHPVAAAAAVGDRVSDRRWGYAGDACCTDDDTTFAPPVIEAPTFTPPPLVGSGPQPSAPPALRITPGAPSP